jgi:hypothetical protein
LDLVETRVPLASSGRLVLLDSLEGQANRGALETLGQMERLV